MFSGAVTSTQFMHPGRDPCLNYIQPWERQRECERKVGTDLQRAAFTNQPSRRPWLEGFVSEAIFRIRQLSAEAEPKLIGPIWRKIFSNSISHLLISFFLSVPPLVLRSSFKLSLFRFFSLPDTPLTHSLWFLKLSRQTRTHSEVLAGFAVPLLLSRLAQHKCHCLKVKTSAVVEQALIMGNKNKSRIHVPPPQKIYIVTNLWSEHMHLWRHSLCFATSVATLHHHTATVNFKSSPHL